MSNDEVQPQEKNAEGETRKSKIRLGIERTLTTARYESIKIIDQIEEEITWNTVEERQKKKQNWETVLLQSFKKSHDRILEELNLSHKKAYFVNHVEEKDCRPEPGSTHELDELDSLGS